MQPKMGRDQARGELRRSLILAAMTEKPGSCIRELARMTELATGTLMHHLRRLKRDGRAIERRLGMRCVWFPAGPLPSVVHTALAREPGLAVLRDFVASHPGCSPVEVQRAFPVPRSTIQHRLQRLITIEAVKRQARGVRTWALYAHDEPPSASGPVGVWA